MTQGACGGASTLANYDLLCVVTSDDLPDDIEALKAALLAERAARLGAQSDLALAKARLSGRPGDD